MKRFTRSTFILAVGALTIATGALAQRMADSDAAKVKAPFAHLKVAGSIGFGLAKAVETKSTLLKNTGTLAADVTVTGPSQPSPFTVTVGAGSYSIAPGAAATITVQFAPTAKGPVKQTIAIACPTCDTKASQNLVVRLSGNAKGPLPTPTSTASPMPPGANALPFSVTPGTFDALEEGFASITVCATGTSNCTTVHEMLVDTGSSGLRIFGSQLAGLGIVPNSHNANEVGECAFFGSGSTWGAVSTVDVKMAGEPTITVPIQVMDDTSAFAPAPSDCTDNSQLITSPSEVGFNGLLGLGQTLDDVPNIFSEYFDCSGENCSTLMNPLNGDIVLNPVPLLPTDNNGVVVSLPAVAAGGQASVDGTLFFGIGTQSNNQPGTVKTYQQDNNINDLEYLDITTVYKGKKAGGFFDTGSNGFFFNSTIAACSDAPDFYCPKSTTMQTATNKSIGSSVSGTVKFSVANSDNLFNSNNAAFNDLAGSFDGSTTFDGFDWGLPFFFGRTVYLGIAGAATPLGPGPYTAY